MSHDLTRRELLAALGAVALSSLVAPRSSFVVPRSPSEARDLLFAAAPTARLSPFDLADVRLLPGIFLDAQRLDERYLLSLEPDRMLHNFRVNASLTPKAPIYGGWESEEPWVDIRCHGHTLGHYLSAVAMMYASTGDARFKDRGDYIVAELRECQRARGDGLVCAFPDGSKPLDDAVAGRRFRRRAVVTRCTRSSPVYAMRTCTPRALTRCARLTELSEWIWRATRDMSDEQLQRMLDVEHGGMIEVLARCVGDRARAEIPRARAAVRASEGFHAVVGRRDSLDGLHANTQIPKVVGFERLHELTKKPDYGVAAAFFWRTVAERRSFATAVMATTSTSFPSSISRSTSLLRRPWRRAARTTCCGSRASCSWSSRRLHTPTTTSARSTTGFSRRRIRTAE
jgi:DUF1680 family protein